MSAHLLDKVGFSALFYRPKNFHYILNKKWLTTKLFTHFSFLIWHKLIYEKALWSW